MPNQFDEFWRGYLSALMFTAHDTHGGSLFDCPQGGQFEDEYPVPNWFLLDETDITAKELAELYDDAIAFYLDEVHGMGYDDDLVFSAGSDFHFTRNRHGVGFWDDRKKYPDGHADRLDAACEAYGTLELTGRRKRNGKYAVYVNH